MAFVIAVATIQPLCVAQVTTSATVDDPSLRLKALVNELPRSLRLSGSVLMGSRDPLGPSCLPVVRSGDIKGAPPPALLDLDGGPGSRLATLYLLDRQRVKSAKDDYVWHQGRLRTFLANERFMNSEARAELGSLLTEARALAAAVSSCKKFPEQIKAMQMDDAPAWPAHCLWKLNAAIQAENLPQTQRWADELAASLFALDDLHRWLQFLIDNQQLALQFQARCEPMFAAADLAGANYDILSSISQFPAGVLSLNCLTNYFEVERQAEFAFNYAGAGLDEANLTANLTSASVHMAPDARECFLKASSALSPANRRMFELAAQSTFEHSYLANVLYRAWASGCADQLVASLKRFDKNNPNADMDAMMDALLYRGNPYGGLEWDDRYHPQLVRAGEQLSALDRNAAFLAAHAATNRFFNLPVVYAATTTLRESIEQNRLDCVRGSDMISAIYRNAGQSGMGSIRWCGGVASHTVAAMVSNEKGVTRVRVLDGMTAAADPLEWPDTYFGGANWPPMLAKNPQPYAAELYLRGIDGYIWAEGYIIQGPDAGTLTKAPVPYLPARSAGSTARVHSTK